MPLALSWLGGERHDAGDETEDESLARNVVEQVGKSGRLRVLSVKSRPQKLLPPVGLNTVQLLVAGSKALGMSPKQVMNVAEKLYSAGFISYPRTETTKYDPNGFDVRVALREHAKQPDWGKAAGYLLRGKYSKSGRPPQGGVDKGDHPPITPTRAANREDVGGGAAWRVYEYIARSFIGSLGDELSFHRRVTELGFDADVSKKVAFQHEQVFIDSLGFAGACSWVLRDIGAVSKDEKSNQLQVVEGQHLTIASSSVEDCYTTPPRFLQEHELIELMDANRIGTDASMATHVANIIDRGYVTVCDETGEPLRPPRPPMKGRPSRPRQIGRYLVPSPLGMTLLELFGEGKAQPVGTTHLLSQPAIRAKMEAEVKQIAAGDCDKEAVVSENLEWFQARFAELEASLSKKRVDEFQQCLRPMKEQLKRWRLKGFFVKAAKASSGGQGRNGKKSNAKRSGAAGSKKQSKQRISSTRTARPSAGAMPSTRRKVPARQEGGRSDAKSSPNARRQGAAKPKSNSGAARPRRKGMPIRT